MDHSSPSVGYILTGKEKKVNLRYILAFHFAPSAALSLSLRLSRCSFAPSKNRGEGEDVIHEKVGVIN